MPFDGTDFPRKRPGRGRATRDDNVISFIILALAFALLVMPVTMTATVDIVRYVRGL